MQRSSGGVDRKTYTLIHIQSGIPTRSFGHNATAQRYSSNPSLFRISIPSTVPHAENAIDNGWPPAIGRLWEGRHWHT